MSLRIMLFFIFCFLSFFVFPLRFGMAEPPAIADPLRTSEWIPLAIDKNKDMKISVTEKEKVYFDVLGTNFRAATLWINMEDAFLFFDRNSNGAVDNGAEIVGESAGLASVETLDDNKDGGIDDKDSSFAKLWVWNDITLDGRSQNSELRQLSGSIVKENGGWVLKAPEGSLPLMPTVLRADKVNTVAKTDSIPLNFSALMLPELRGYGQIPNLSIAMSAKPELLKIAQELASMPIEKVFADFNIYQARFDQLLYVWGGVEKIDPAIRGPHTDARRLALMEVLLGREWKYPDGVRNPEAGSSMAIESVYEGIKTALLTHFLTQSGGTALFSGSVSFDRLKGGLVLLGGGEAPVLSTPAIEKLGEESKKAKDGLAYWASVMFYIQQVRGTLEGMSSGEIAALDAGIKKVAPRSGWEIFSKNYLAVMSCVPCFPNAAKNAKDNAARKGTRAEAGASATPIDPALTAIPLPLLRTLGNGQQQFEEQYISRVLMTIRSTGRAKDRIDRQDIDGIKERREREIRRSQVQKFLSYDRNFDGSVARAEIEASIADRPGNIARDEAVSKRNVEELMAADKNGDGIIDMGEMSTLSQGGVLEKLGRIYGQEGAGEFLALDPDGDGALTVPELEKLARDAFRAADKDDDNTLSSAEQQAVSAALRSVAGTFDR